jgi:hypothetical protein
MNERKLIREFLDQASNVCLACGYNPCKCIEVCGSCHCDPCECPGHDVSSNYDNLQQGEAHHEIDLEQDGTISPHELFHHFDLNDDGRVTPQEYVDHIEYHAAYPETLDKYRELSSVSRQSVPCTSSYDSCSQHFMSNPDDMNSVFEPIMQMTGSSCIESSLYSIIDVLKCLKEKGLI